MATLIDRVPRPASQLGRDALGALAVAVLLVMLTLGGGVDSDGWIRLAAGLVASLALVWRRRFPGAVLVVALVAFAVGTVLGSGVSGAFVPLVVALYTAVVSVAEASLVFVWGAVSLIVVGGTLAGGLGLDADDAEVVSAEVWIALAVAVGVAMRLYRRSVAAERDRAVRAEETRDAVARQHVAEERLRIARELHDVVGHQIAVVSVQAGVAEHLLSTRPDKAREALERVQDAAARVLEELPVMLRVLRQDDDPAEAVDRAPAPGLADLPALIDEARAAGLEVTFHEEGTMPALGSASDLAAYRVAQEALTNARRHGSGAVSVLLSGSAGAVALEARNAVGPVDASRPESGFGLMGMRERVSAAGGTLEAAPVGGEFVLRAVLPARGVREENP